MTEMTGDRKLTLDEKMLFLQHKTEFATKITQDEGEPTLHDVAIIEIFAKLDAQKSVIIDLGRKIRNQQYEFDGLRQRLEQLEVPK